MSIETDRDDSSGRGWKQRLSWLRNEPEAGIALLIAVGAAVVDLIADLVNPDMPSIVDKATLVVLALVATTLIRSRLRTGEVETELRRLLADSRGTLKQLPSRFDEVTESLGQARQAIDQVSVVSLVAGSQVRAELVAASRNTNMWIFKGGTGTFIRAFTLPECVENCRVARRQLRMQLEIIDPENLTACEVYARFRRSLVTGRTDPWSADRTRAESYATVLAASWYRKHNDFLTIRVGLSSTMTTCRWDMAASRVVVTREDPTAPAMVAYHDKLYYSWCETELNSSFGQSRRIPIERVLTVPLGGEPSVDEVRDLFQVLGLSLDSLDDSEVIDVTRRALQPEDPYR
ncbi:hypothetical protein [Streptosporangium lutulentum]|uniref:Uncharacterized protein n=1 Tax=Streptosporangium lutulentum TaxID=1461250 RepID=A0ABT9QDK9_9ACTN|nr:hypothetical protein [Streptosporangium lutulentum]MDP9844853.1 hypothetical protein [Streptosporangium lutulentum]